MTRPEREGQRIDRGDGRLGGISGSRNAKVFFTYLLTWNFCRLTTSNWTRWRCIGCASTVVLTICQTSVVPRFGISVVAASNGNPLIWTRMGAPVAGSRTSFRTWNLWGPAGAAARAAFSAPTVVATVVAQAARAAPTAPARLPGRCC